MKKIAIIGGGAFGAMTALRLADSQYDVTLFERLPNLMQGASYNDQNRLHLGFHYPKDEETARQCLRGFDRFRQEFSESILDGFVNAYFIAAERSRTSPEEFLAFCSRHRLAAPQVDLAAFSPRVRHVALGVLTGEVVYDSAILRGLIERRLQAAGIRVMTAREVTSIKRVVGGFELGFDGEAQSFDGVVNCCYANINALTSQLGHRVETPQYEYTAVPVVEIDWPAPVGITIMDGPFMTVLPFGKTGKHLLYHVEHVVIDRDDRGLLNPAWLDKTTSPFSTKDKQSWFDRLVRSCSEFVPDLRRARPVGFLEGPRMVLKDREDTDARPSIVTRHERGYISVFSGKIDHCVWVADEVLEKLDGDAA